MQLVKLITPKRIKTLYCLPARKHLLAGLILVSLFSASAPAFSQDNSPYSRYGIGDPVPQTNIANRGMGSISAAYSDPLSINFNNPASYTSFQKQVEARSKKLKWGRAILDVGMNFESRTLNDPAFPQKFVAGNALFSYVQVAMPVRQNWGISFGLRPVSRISYKIIRNELLVDPITGLPIENATTRFTGDGGAYLASAGTGFALFRGEKFGLERKLSVGLNAGYMFGRKDYSTRRALNNDTVDYYQANYETRTNFGSFYFNTGFQYTVPVSKNMMFTVGAHGSWSQKLKAKQDILRETYFYDESLGNMRLDSVFDQRDIKGELVMPGNFTVGVALQKYAIPNKEGGWLFGLDFEQQGWDKYRFYGQQDSVKSKWELRLGAQLTPVPKRNYFSNVTYRFGLFTGPDYIKVGSKLSQFGGSIGFGLPIAGNAQARNQYTLINIALEYIKRGNSNNILKENLFRFSLGFSLSDVWFGKKQYD